MHELRIFHPGRRARAAQAFDFERASLQVLAAFQFVVRQRAH